MSQGIQADVVVTVPGAGYVGEIGLVARAGGGSGTGAYGFASSTPAVCTVAGATGGITASHAGWCTLTATREGDVNYLPATSAPQGFQVAPGAQAAVLLAVPGSGTVGQLGLVAHASGGSGTGAYSYASSTPIVCTVVGATGSIVVSHVGTCTLTATRAGDADFVPATSAAQSFEAGPGVQSTVWLSVPGSGHVGQTDLVAHASGGSGTGAYSYASSTPSVCTVDAATGSIAATTVGECRLTATRAADADYQSATSAAGWFWVDKRLQAPVVLTVPAAGRVDQERLFAVASGGSGSGQYRYASLTPAICGVNQLMGNIWATAVGTCSLRATKLGDAEYLPATSAAQSFQVDKGTQAPLVLTVPASGYVGEPGLVATASGGSGTGAYVFTSYSWYVCSVDAATGGVTASSAGTCRLTVTKAGDANYLGDTSEVQSFVVDKQKQAPVLLTVPEVGLVGQSGLVATASGGSGTGAFSYVSHSPSFCDVDPVTGSITAKAGGVCILSATKAGDADFQPATSGWKSFNVLLGY